MALRKRAPTQRVSAAEKPFEIDAKSLMEAFQSAWEGALNRELITSANVQHAPRDLMRCVIIAAENGAGSVEETARAALDGWDSARCAIADLTQAQPPTNSIN